MRTITEVLKATDAVGQKASLEITVERGFIVARLQFPKDCARAVTGATLADCLNQLVFMINPTSEALKANDNYL